MENDYLEDENNIDPQEEPSGPSVGDKIDSSIDKARGIQSELEKRRAEKEKKNNPNGETKNIEKNTPKNGNKKNTGRGTGKAAEKEVEKEAAEKGAERAATVGAGALGPEASVAAKAATVASDALEKAGISKKKQCGCFCLSFFAPALIILPLAFGFLGLMEQPSAADPTNPIDDPSDGPISSGNLLLPPNLGSPNLLGYYQMPKSLDGSYSLYGCNTGNQRWGDLKLIQVLYTVSTNWAKAHPTHKIQIGDLNASGHRSHKWGRGVDIDAPGLMLVDGGSYKRDLTIELAKEFFKTGLILRIFYDDPTVNNAVNSWAKANGLPGYMQAIGGHANHFHIDLNIPKGPEWAPAC